MQITLRKKFTEKVLNQFKKGKSKRDRLSGGGIDLLETDLISLNINGSISIKGDLIFKEQEMQYSSQYGSGNDWELDIEQTQRFTINGKIGKKRPRTTVNPLIYRKFHSELCRSGGWSKKGYFRGSKRRRRGGLHPQHR